MGINPIFSAHTWELLPFHFWSVCFFMLGCIVGSFLNVCIHRMPRGLSIISPPSHCPHCKYSIPWYLNVPLVTWLVLRGRCKNCGAPISSRYFIVELLTGVSFLACWLAYGSVLHPLPSIPVALVYSVFLAGLITATFIDFEHLIIPDEITFGGIAVGMLLSFLLPQLQKLQPLEPMPPHHIGLLRSFIGAVVGAAIIYAIVRGGKLLFGKYRVKLPEGTKVFFSETALHLPDREISYDELFYRKSDVIVVRARTVELVDRGYKDVTVRLSPVRLEIEATTGPSGISRMLQKVNPRPKPFVSPCPGEPGYLDYINKIVIPRQSDGRNPSAAGPGENAASPDQQASESAEKMSPDGVPFMECESAEIVLPREAMGLGDVKFMSAIGAFIGWQGVVFSLMASSMIGAACGLLMIVLRRREFSSRMPYGPYIALAAVIWVFIGKKYFMLLFNP
jgi:leader peptidase (prepilin peptidase) / N-methyltransferase